MKTERLQRIETELSKFSNEQLNKRNYQIDKSAINDLAMEAGYNSSTEYMNEGVGWNATLRESITDLVNVIYTIDDTIYDTLEEKEKQKDL